MSILFRSFLFHYVYFLLPLLNRLFSFLQHGSALFVFHLIAFLKVQVKIWLRLLVNWVAPIFFRGTLLIKLVDPFCRRFIVRQDFRILKVLASYWSRRKSRTVCLQLGCKQFILFKDISKLGSDLSWFRGSSIWFLYWRGRFLTQILGRFRLEIILDLIGGAFVLPMVNFLLEGYEVDP